MRPVSARFYNYFLMILFASFLAGCAPTDLVLKPVYQPVGVEVGTGGELVFAMLVDSHVRPGSEAVSSVYGDVKKSDGKVVGNIISSLSPALFMREALRQELAKAGYDVKIESALPKGVQQGIVVTNAVISLDETTSIVKMEGNCKINLVIELWKQGVMTKTLTYEKNISDYAVKDREKLHNQLLQKALSAVMKDAQADIVNFLGKKAAK